jgi:hypothetical protein
MRGNTTFDGKRRQRKTLHFDNSSMHRLAVRATHTSKALFKITALQKLVDG